MWSLRMTGAVLLSTLTMSCGGNGAARDTTSDYEAGEPAGKSRRSPTARRRPETVKRTLLFLGTSLTAGLGLDPDSAYPQQIQRKIDAIRLPYQVVNAGVSGETSAGSARRLDWVLRRPAAVIVVETGANDGLRGLPVSATSATSAVAPRIRREQPTPRSCWSRWKRRPTSVRSIRPSSARCLRAGQASRERRCCRSCWRGSRGSATESGRRHSPERCGGADRGRQRLARAAAAADALSLSGRRGPPRRAPARTRAQRWRSRPARAAAPLSLADRALPRGWRRRCRAGARYPGEPCRPSVAMSRPTSDIFVQKIGDAAKASTSAKNSSAPLRSATPKALQIGSAQTLEIGEMATPLRSSLGSRRSVARSAATASPPRGEQPAEVAEEITVESSADWRTAGATAPRRHRPVRYRAGNQDAQ